MLRGKLIVFFVVIVRAVLVSPRHDDAGCPRCCAVIVSRDVSTPLNQFARCRRLAGVAADLGPRTRDLSASSCGAWRGEAL